MTVPLAAPSRPKRRRLAVLLLAAVALVGSFAIWQATSLRGLPVIPDPFDLRDFGTIEVPEDENAFTFYRRATDRFQGHESDIPRTTVFDDWSIVDSRYLKPLEANREALLLWFEGSKRDRAIYIQPKDGTFDTELPVTQRFRSFARLANLEAFRLQHAGDYPGSWAWLRANLRASRHSGRDGFFMERLVGTTLYESASKQAMVWSDDPKVDASLLREALRDVLALDALSPSMIGVVRAEFFAALHTLDDPDSRDRLTGFFVPPEQRVLAWRGRRLAYDASVFLGREPERSRRLVRLLATSWLSACDLPPDERSKRSVQLGKFIFYRPPPGDPLALPPEEMARWLESARFVKEFVSLWSDVEKVQVRYERARARLIVHLAEQLYLRERGKPPASADELVGPYLEQIPTGYAPTDDPKPEGPPR